MNAPCFVGCNRHLRIAVSPGQASSTRIMLHVNEWVGKKVVKFNPLLRIHTEQANHQISAVNRQRHRCRQRHATSYCLQLTSDRLHVADERSSAVQTAVQNHAHRPKIRFGVELPTQQHLRRHVQKTAAQADGFVLNGKRPREAEIAQLQHRIWLFASDENVLWFQIEMTNGLRPQILQRTGQLSDQSQEKSTNSTMCGCFNFFNNEISAIKLSSDSL
ncbi:hypothetical protein T12_3184 [Trichinella patagoniensis]|uniref:Uncharacterized protein n=1 Tax=Trichinella patagoniensis TaxID=990121 RepID=A0A0V0Z8M9_9BILA|nr:hypothetical protein T12_3184 [Trichinella patagoniensis]